MLLNSVNYALFNHDPNHPLSVVSSNLAAGYFQNNAIDPVTGVSPLPIEYDGVSHVLKIVAPIIPGGATNHIKIGIADTGDHIYDSGIFVANFAAGTIPGSGVVATQPGDCTDNSDVVTGSTQDEYFNLKDGNDTLYAGAGDDIVVAGNGNDVVYGGSGNDEMAGGSGDDSFDGGDGLADTAVYAGASSSYSVVYNASGNSFYITDSNTGTGSEGKDTLTNVEQVKFSDGLFTLGVNGLTPASNSGTTPPTNTPGIVLISGIGSVGNTLTATVSDQEGIPGAISYQWQSSLDQGSSWSNIAGAVNSSYLVSAGDVGNLIQVAASYVDGGAQAESPVSLSKSVLAAKSGDLVVTLMKLAAPAGTSIINPLTTLLKNAVDLGLSPTVAAQDIKKVLGIPVDVKLQSYDAYSVLQLTPKDPVALAVEKVAVEVAILTSLSDDDTGMNLTLAILGAAAMNKTYDLAKLNDVCAILGVDPLGTLPGSVTVIVDRNSSMSSAIKDGGTVADIEKEWVDFCGIQDKVNSTSIADLSIHINQGPEGSATTVLPEAVQNQDYLIAEGDLLQGFTDPEGGVLGIALLQTDGTGNLQANPDGTWSFTPSADYTGPVELTYSVVDGQGGALVASQLFVVAPAPMINNAPVVTNTADAQQGSVTEAGYLVAGSAAASGTLTASDVDTGATQTWSIADTTPESTYGSIAIEGATGVWTYALDNTKTATQGLQEGETAIQSYIARVTDEFGACADQTITITIHGTNDLPTVSAPLSTTLVDGDPAVILNLLANAHDVDLTDTLRVGNVTSIVNGELSALPAGVTMNGNTLAIDPGSPAYTALAQGEQTTIVVTYQVLDSVASAETSFAPKVDYATGTESWSVISADVNGDGKPDLIADNFYSNTVSVLKNNGDGTFAPKVDYATGVAPISVTSADVNGDGKTDLIVANNASNTVSVLKNNGDSTFTPKVDYATGSAPHSVTSADVNGDGKSDLIVTNWNSNTISVLKNNGDGTFAERVDYATGSVPSTVTSADVNGDGKSDLIVANYGSNTLSVLDNNGDGTFASKVDYATGLCPISVTSADVNGDGKSDLIVTNGNSSTVSVLMNKGDGVFTARVDYTTGFGPSLVTSVDVNGDGKLDLIVANQFSDTVSVLANKGDGTFALKVDYTTGSHPNSVTSADVNGDAKPDLIVANLFSYPVSVLLNTSTGFIGYPTTTETITITGTNDAPVVDATDVTGAAIERVTPVGNLTDSGTIGFTDVDFADIHTVGVVTPSAGALGTLAPTITADTTGTGVGGVVTWNYSVAASAVEYLAGGETKVETFTFSLLDGHGGNVERTVSVTLTGMNDDTVAPTLISSTPVDNATAVSGASDITLTFSEAIQRGTGVIEIHSGSPTGSLVASYDVAASGNLTIYGTTLTINPTADLAYGTHYFVTVSNGSVKDLANNSYAGTNSYDFTTDAAAPIQHRLTGGVTFWKTGVPIAGVTSILTSVPAAVGTQPVEFKNIQTAADGTRTLEIWENSTKTDIDSLQLEFSFSAGSVATWQDAATLPLDWNSLANTEIPGQFILGGIGTTALAAGPVKLGTLTLTAPVNPQHFDLSLKLGELGNDTVPLFGIASDSMTTGADGLFQHLALAGGTYALTKARVSGVAEGDAIKSTDALAALKIAVGINPNADSSAVSPYQYLAADVNKDGQVKAADALNILKMAVKLGTAPEKEWLFVPESVGSETMSRTHVVWSDNPIPVTLDVDQELHLIGIVKGDVDGSWAA